MIDFIHSNSTASIQVMFVGLAGQDAALKRVQVLIKGYEDYFIFTERVPKRQAIEIQAKSHFLLICAYKGLKGIPGSKLYEYIALKKPVLVCPNDKDIIEATLRFTKQGIFADSSEQCKVEIEKIYRYWIINRNIDHYVSVDETAIESFSRRNQTLKLTALLNEL